MDNQCIICGLPATCFGYAVTGSTSALATHQFCDKHASSNSVNPEQLTECIIALLKSVRKNSSQPIVDVRFEFIVRGDSFSISQLAAATEPADLTAMPMLQPSTGQPKSELIRCLSAWYPIEEAAKHMGPSASRLCSLCKLHECSCIGHGVEGRWEKRTSTTA